MNKKYCLLILLFILSSCKEKKEEESINIGNNDININAPENIYHAIYTNVVKIQGKFVDMSSSYSYGGREEGKYSEDYDIFEAIENGSLRRVMELINEGADINTPYYKEYKNFPIGNEELSVYKAVPLTFAVLYRDLGIIKYLLDNNADPNIADNDGWNSFMWACNSGNIDAIKMLIQRYPYLITSENKNGANVLHLAALGGNIEAIEYLVKDLGMDIESVDNDGDGVFYYAYENNEVIEKFRELGAKDND